MKSVLWLSSLFKERIATSDTSDTELSLRSPHGGEEESISAIGRNAKLNTDQKIPTEDHGRFSAQGQ